MISRRAFLAAPLAFLNDVQKDKPKPSSLVLEADIMTGEAKLLQPEKAELTSTDSLRVISYSGKGIRYRIEVAVTPHATA